MIPPSRCSENYLLRSLENKGYSSVLHGFLSDGVIRPPRRDWRRSAMSLLRWPFTPALHRRAEEAMRRGAFRAVRELRHNLSELEAYARALHKRAVALEAGKR